MPIDWPTATLNAIKRECARSSSATFSRQSLIANELSRIVSETISMGATPAQTLSRILQTLRDAGHVEFLGAGDYRLIGFQRVQVGPETQAKTDQSKVSAVTVATPPGKPIASAEPGIAVDIGEPNSTTRANTIIRRIIRDTKIVAELKRLYEFRCQICGFRIDLLNGVVYCEAHHIRPVGSPHDGPDTISNLIIVCPNHHAMLDYASIPIVEGGLLHRLHQIDPEHIRYHNSELFGRPLPSS